MSKHIYIIAGEASGDLYGSKLLAALHAIDPELKVRGWGGEKMAAEGCALDVRYEEASFMGFAEVILNLRKIMGLFKLTKKSILRDKPDAMVLIDYPGFNLRMAEWAKKNNIKVYFYIAPQAWAWKENRVLKLKKYVDKLFIILPFEKEFFSRHGINAYYFGHPLMHHIKEFKADPDFLKRNQLDERPVIALLPGSRKQEIKTMLKIFLQGLEDFKSYQLVIAGLPHHQELYQEIIEKSNIHCKVIYQETYNLLSISKAALVTSGTATLETALFGVPQIVCYKGNWISYQIAKRLIKVKYISLVNLIADQKIIEELIQDDMNPERISYELTQLLEPQKYQEIKNAYSALHELLILPDTEKRIAEVIYHDL